MTPEEHRAAAEDLIRQAAEVYQELRDVPVDGVMKTGNPTDYVGGRPYKYRMTQTERRDELGKSLMGKYALAQVHATLYAADQAWLQAHPTAMSTPYPWFKKLETQEDSVLAPENPDPTPDDFS